MSDTKAMHWQTVRVFISSTFRDFHAERDYLVKYVFPELRQWCEKWKIHLVDIDLRWGVTGAEAESGKVIDICLENIDGSRPFFICMLGSRYGWVPDGSSVPRETLTHYAKLRDRSGFSITHLEILHAVFEPLDESGKEAVPNAFFYFRDGGSLPRPESIASITDAERNEYAKAFFESDPAMTARLDTLKESVIDHFAAVGREKGNPEEVGERVFRYSPTFDPSLRNPEDNKLMGRITKESLREFGERVKNDMRKAIGLQFAERIEAIQRQREEDPLERERDYQESFIENRTMLFIGRTALLDRLSEYAASGERKILAVYGEPGSGKSALLAQFCRKLAAAPDSAAPATTSTFVIPHFVGASPESTSLASMLARLCGELCGRFGLKNEIPSDVNKLRDLFLSCLTRASERTVILIDGLNQLDGNDDAHTLFWLPSELPENVRIIASTLEGDTRDALREKTDLALDIPRLTLGERTEIIRLMPSVFCKTMDQRHIDLLLKKESTANPLYLKVAIDELRVFGSFEKLEEMIASFPEGVVNLFVHMLDRLSRDHDPEIVERLFCLLVCSRYGLTIRELTELMAEADTDMEHRVILREIRGYIHNRGELIDFFHRGLAKAVRNKYFGEGV